MSWMFHPTSNHGKINASFFLPLFGIPSLLLGINPPLFS
ncbi:hypothetical protein B4119_1581 [Parageobacillus caldoxylosilyticus]|uniref:Uncharacterized protein n=1 Tax=Saccharococcus caldoxylosilyticus TaxID=81408 RepID=A0A150M4X8_9BACL|nr:hypothetical protein B4119_1581 [Parageobacillus caldoxylosilyticus]